MLGWDALALHVDMPVVSLFMVIPRLQRHGDESTPYETSAWCFVEACATWRTVVDTNYTQTSCTKKHVASGSAHSRQSLGGFFRVQASISSAIKPSDSRLDLGNVGIDDLCDPRNDFHSDILMKCIKTRLPPLLPQTVKEKFDNEEVVFTKKGDKGVVAELYRKFFEDVSGSAEELKRRT